MQLSIRGEDRGHLIIKTPYHPEVVRVLRSIPGRRWDTANRDWIIDDTQSNLDEILKELLHTDLFTFRDTSFKDHENLSTEKNLPSTDQKYIGTKPSLLDHLDPGIIAVKRELQLAGYSIRTIKAYESQVRRFFRRTGCPPAQVTRDRIVLYLDEVSESVGLSRSGAVHCVSALRHFFRINYPHRYPNPADSIPVPRQSRKYPDILSKEEVFKLLGALSNIKHRFLLSLAYSGGLRVSEVVRLKVADLDFDRGDAAAHEPYAKLERFLDATVIAVPERAQVHVEDGDGQLREPPLGEDGLLERDHAARRGAERERLVPRSDALDERNGTRLDARRSAQRLTLHRCIERQ